MNKNMQSIILIVEDNPGHRNIYKEYFEGTEHRISFAINYEEAIKALKDETYDVAIIDVRLDNDRYDNRDGLRIAGAISKMVPAPRVILATAYADEIDTQTAQYVADIFDKSNIGSEKRVLELVNRIPSSKKKPQLILADVGYSLQKIIERMAREKIPVKTVYEQILEFLTPLTGADMSNFFIVKENQLVPGATYPLPGSGDLVELKVEDSISGLAIRRYHYVYEPDLQKESDITKLYKRGLINACSELAIPIIFGIEPIGVINFESSQSRAFDKVDKEFFEKEVAPLIAFAIHDARLQQSLIDQAKHVIKLSDISEELNSIIWRGEEWVAKIVLDKMIEFLKCEKAAIFMVKEQGDEKIYYLLSHIWLSQEYEEKSQRIDLSSPRAYTARTGLRIYINDIENDDDIRFQQETDFVRSMARKEGYRSILEQPLQIQENTFGSIVAYYREPTQFKDGSEELALAQMFADHAAIAMENARQYQELESAKKREKKAIENRLAGEVLHRLVNPMGLVRTWIIQAKNDCGELIESNSDLSEAFEHIKINAEKAMKLVSELQDSIYKIKAENLDLNESIKSVVENTLLPSNVTLITELHKKPIIVYVDSEINRVIRNLIENAIHPSIMPNGGKLRISTRIVGDIAEAQVEDTGIGIPKENIYDILQPWYTTKPGKGHGLGLWWTQNYIQVFGGEVKLESQVGIGTRVTIQLPISKEDEKKFREDLLNG